MSFHGHSCPSIMIICIQLKHEARAVAGVDAGMARHFFFLATGMVLRRELVPYANCIPCI